MIIDKVIFIHIYRLLQEKMRNPATAGFAGVLFPKIVWLLSALNLCVKNGTTILGDNLTDFFIGYGVFVLSLTDIALAVNYKPVFKTEQTFEEVSREFYFHPSRCKVLIGIYLVLTIGFAVYGRVCGNILRYKKRKEHDFTHKTLLVGFYDDAQNRLYAQS